ncbi:MAG: hypothetical protein WCQ74_05330 [Saccharofermentanales bacterium]
MKVLKTLLCSALVATMLFCMVGCVNVKAVNKKDFKNALEDVADFDDDEYYEYDDYDSDNYYTIYAYDSDAYYNYSIYGDEDYALDAFEDIYDEFQDMKEDKDFDGSLRMGLSGSTGYILFNGEADGSVFDDEAYGGIYLKDDVVIMVYALSDSKSDIKDINAFLSAIGLPKP